MSSFTADWLALREPYDTRARDTGLVRELGAWAARRAGLRIVDLGAGTGSTLRALSPLLPAAQSWSLVELDPTLIEAGHAAMSGSGLDVTYRKLDLATSLEEALDGGPDLVTTSALLDLVGEDWLAGLVAAIERSGAALYAALTFDGRLRWRPGDILDRDVRHLFHRHQEGDKGLGPALGPQAAQALWLQLEAIHRRMPGATLLRATSDWRLAMEDRTIQSRLLAGYADCAASVAPDMAEDVHEWRAQRQRAIDAGRSLLSVGHTDILWLPPEPAG